MNPHLLPLLLGKKSLAGAVIAILRKYGTDAHVYLPGIGVINGLTAGNYLDSAGTTAATVDNPVGLVVDSGGINAIQATTAKKAILRYASGKYSWQFDGADDYLSGSSRLFNVIDNHVIVAGVTNTKPSGTSSVFSEGNTAAAESFYNLRVLSNAVAVGVRANDGVTLVTTATVPLSLSETGVIAVNGTGGTIKIRKNGGTWTAGAVAPSPVTLNSFGIGVLFRANGASNADYFQGSIYPIIVIKSTVTDTELLTLEKFVGMLSGVTI